MKDKPTTRRRLYSLPLWIVALALGLLACSAPVLPSPTSPALTPTAEAGLTTTDGEAISAGAATTETATTGGAGENATLPAFDPNQVKLAVQTVATGLDQPLYATHAGDGSGRLFIVEKPGVIRIWMDVALAAEPFLDIQDRVNSNANEQGLLGLAFAPDYADSGRFFVNYTDEAGDTVISRFLVTAGDANRADPASEEVVLAFDQPARNHNGGMLAFGPDGMLWIGTGDGGGGFDSFGNGQNPDTWLGKMLRIDVTSDPSQPYTIPADNPWVTADWNGAEVRDEIWAVGLRNPWRYSFDRATGDLWIGDVGQNQAEEINFVPANSAGGLNFGWPLMEASQCLVDACETDELVLPVAEYTHGGGHCSVTGGYVYRGEQFPAIEGVYFFGDYCSGVIWGTWRAADGGWRTEQVLAFDGFLSSFGEDEAGEIYLTDLSGGAVSQLVVEE